MLTRKQHELLMFIHERIKETGISPSFDEMKEALDLASKSGIHRLITALEERGFLRRLPHRARALEVVRLPEARRRAGAPRRAGFEPQRHRGQPRRLRRGLPAAPATTTCAAGRAAARWAASPPARRSSAIQHEASDDPRAARACWARASTTSSRCRAIRWSTPASSTATS